MKQQNTLNFNVIAKAALWLATGSGVSVAAFGATWENQAERLQLVSASFLDAQPLLSPATRNNVNGQFRIEAKAVVSVLPKLNATVGAKTEQPPQPPAHAVPTLEGSYISPKTVAGYAVLRAWAGLLPESAAKSTGMKASCGQKINGFSLGLKSENLGFVDAVFEAGQQWSLTKIKGGITEADSNDMFNVSSRLRFLTMTFLPHSFSSLWFQAQVTERDVSMHFEIPKDGTSFDLKDQSSIAGGTAASQFTLGYDVGRGLQVAAGLLNVPHRVTMPRFLMSYSVAIGDQGHRLASVN
jgi:hypothetical protein